MGLWVKRVLVGLWLLVFALGLTLFYGGTAIVESLLAPTLAERGGVLDIESIELRSGGLDIQIRAYEEAILQIEGLSFVCPWSQLWSYLDGLEGRFHARKISILSGGAPDAADTGLQVPAAVAGELAGLLDAFPLKAVEIAVDELELEFAGETQRAHLALSLVRGAAGDSHLSAQLGGVAFQLELRGKVSAQAEGLALDFAGSAQDWSLFQEQYLQPLKAALALQQWELHVNPLVEDRGFLDFSGYLRWTSEQADVLAFTLLADLGATALYAPGGECFLEPMSLGLAGDGAGKLHAFAKGAVESLRHGSWLQSGGDWALRMDGSRLAAECRLGEALVLSLGHADWREALNGRGDVQFYLHASGVDAEWLRALPLAGIPDDLGLDMDVQIEGGGVLADYALAEADFVVETECRTMTLSERGLTLVGLEGQADVVVSEGQLFFDAVELGLADASISGFTLTGTGLSLERLEGDRYSMSSVRAGFMGGRLKLDPVIINPHKLAELSIHAQVESVELSQVAAAVSQFKGEITGTVSGYLTAGWRQGQVVLTDGRLEVDPLSGARLQYSADGLLTRGMAPGTAAYTQYRMAEKAFADLMLRRFRIEVFPGGDAHRPFRMELSGESEQDGTVVPVDFDLNVNVDDTTGLLEVLRLMRQGKLDLN